MHLWTSVVILHLLLVLSGSASIGQSLRVKPAVRIRAEAALQPQGHRCHGTAGHGSSSSNFPQKVPFLPPETLPSQNGKAEHDLAPLHPLQ